MAAQLTDKREKMILADIAEGMTQRAVASKHGVSQTTIRNVIKRNPETAQMCAEKKEENTADMLSYMESRKGEAQGVIDAYLRALADPSKIEGATLSQIATALGIVVDKFTRNTASENGSLDKLDVLLEEFKNAVKPEAT